VTSAAVNQMIGFKEEKSGSLFKILILEIGFKIFIDHVTIGRHVGR